MSSGRLAGKIARYSEYNTDNPTLPAKKLPFNRISLLLVLLAAFSAGAQDAPPTLDDFWNGRAEWLFLMEDVGLPVGESDTLLMPDGTYWSYLHASTQSAAVMSAAVPA